MKTLPDLILAYLREHPGVVGLKPIRDLANAEGFNLGQLNEALRELKAQKVETCLSCRSFIYRPITDHAGDCPHGG